jgi:hypothetical protein
VKPVRESIKSGVYRAIHPISIRFLAAAGYIEKIQQLEYRIQDFEQLLSTTTHLQTENIKIHGNQFANLQEEVQQLRIKIIELSSPLNNSFAFLTERTNNIKSLFNLHYGEDLNFKRYGVFSDGGYVLVDDISKSDVIFSVGIGSNFSFDSAISQDCNKVIMVDHSIQALYFEEKNMLHIRRKLVPIENNSDEIDLEDLLVSYGGINNILKIDIEGDEWEVLKNLQLKNQKKFRQIVLEVHNLHKLVDVNFYKLYYEVFEKLNLTHRLVVAHANNCASYLNIGGSLIPDVIELTFASREEYELVPVQNHNYAPHLEKWLLLLSRNDVTREEITQSWLFQ